MKKSTKTAILVVTAPIWIPALVVIIPIYLIRYAIVGDPAQRKAADAIKAMYAAHDTNKVIGVDPAEE